MKKINKIFKNFYTEDEYNLLKEYMESNVRNSPLYDREYALGRYYGVIQDKLMTAVSIGNFPESLLIKVQKFAEEHFEIKELKIFDIIVIKYCNENGFVPKLTMHKDGGALTKYTVDYQYSSNINWPVVIEDNEFDLMDNDVVTFIGTEQLHGRNTRGFSNNEFLENIFFQFTEKRN